MNYHCKSIFILLPIIVISCTNSIDKPEKSDYEIIEQKKNILDSINLKEVSKLAARFNVDTEWANIYYTYALQELFESDKHPIFFEGIIKDVTKKDSTYLLKVVIDNNYPFYNAEISVNFSLFQKIRPHLKGKERIEGAFIFNVNSVSSNSLSWTSEMVGDYNYDGTEFSPTFEPVIIFKGNLIDFYLFAQISEYEKLMHVILTPDSVKGQLNIPSSPTRPIWDPVSGRIKLIATDSATMQALSKLRYDLVSNTFTTDSSTIPISPTNPDRKYKQTFIAVAPSSEVKQNKVFQVYLELKNLKFESKQLAEESFKPPSFENFSIIDGPSTSSSTIISDGLLIVDESWSYSLLALKKGKFTLGAASVVAGKEKLNTDQLIIEVHQK